MIQPEKQAFSLNRVCGLLSILFALVTLFSCNAQSSANTGRPVNSSPKLAPERFHFMAHIVEKYSDGSRGEIDTVTGYRKYYYANGKLQMEGKVTKASPKDYRNGIWNYYNEAGQLMKQETSDKEGKLTQLDFMYFSNGKPLSKEYQYFEGDRKDKSTFRLHKIETLYYTNGQEFAERHWVNADLIDEKCWDSKGNPKPIEYQKTVKSLQAE
jgi:hypothetical protein